MNAAPAIPSLIVLAALLTLVPLLLRGILAGQSCSWPDNGPSALRILAPALLGLPYALVSSSTGLFRWPWLALYTLLPVASACCSTERAWLTRSNAESGATSSSLSCSAWRLTYAGLSRHGARVLLSSIKCCCWMQASMVFSSSGSCARLASISVCACSDLGVGLFALAAYTPIAVVLGLWLGFLHFHALMPSVWRVLLGVAVSFFFIAVPEELFFRGWMQNLLERRVGPTRALLITSTLFGLSHFNKRAAFFNWRYVLLAALAGIFYGLAWRQERRVGRRPSPMRRWIRSGESGCDEDDSGSSRSPPAYGVGSNLAQSLRHKARGFRGRGPGL